MRNRKPPHQSCRFIAFYSYKGGTGRTLALANTARLLATFGKRVVIMDFDLEAPGLDHFEVFWPENSDRTRGGNRPHLQGFVEYLDVCRYAGPPSSLKDYVYLCGGRKNDKGKIWIMPAGLHGESHYLEILNKINWEHFYGEEDGYRIMENLRGHIIDEFTPDYVLIDARTGLSEIGGIATHQLADVVVMLFNLNQQNLGGTQQVYNSLRNLSPSPDVILVASPIPNVPVDEGTPFFKRMEWIKHHFEGAKNLEKPLVIPYQPILAFEERILVDDHDDPFSSERPYWQLVKEIQRVVNDPDNFLDHATRSWRERDFVRAEKIIAEGLRIHPNLFDLLERRASLRLILGLNNPEKLQLAIEDLYKLTEIKPRNYTVWHKLGLTLMAAGQPSKAIEAYRKAADINPKNYMNRYKLGEILLRENRYREAIEVFQELVQMRPDNPQVWQHLGIALGKDGQFDDAIKALEKAGDVGLYDLACLYVSKDDRSHALEYLYKAVSKNPKTSSYAATNSLWSNYADDPKFQAIIEEGKAKLK